jgi:hypothetical protein
MGLSKGWYWVWGIAQLTIAGFDVLSTTILDWFAD